MPDYPRLSTRLIGETESALGALLAPLLAEAELTFIQWVVLSLAATGGASSPGIGRDQLINGITKARKVDAADVSAASSLDDEQVQVAADYGQCIVAYPA
jgi:hypothetical protein